MDSHNLLSPEAGAPETGAPEARRYALPKNRRLYAVGDVHGRADLLQKMLKLIKADHLGFRGTSTIIFLGDYLDRGPDSRAVLDILITGQYQGIPFSCLRGNHEDIVLRFFDDPSVAPGWFHYGGLQTLRSYGFPIESATQDFDEVAYYQRKFREALPPEHFSFLQNLPCFLREGDYVFVHAGLHPDEALEGQAPRNYMWMREPFLSSTKPLDAMVVHGHSIRMKPEVRISRIGIDTGAYVTGHLTCLVLDGEERRFLTT